MIWVIGFLAYGLTGMIVGVLASRICTDSGAWYAKEKAIWSGLFWPIGIFAIGGCYLVRFLEAKDKKQEEAERKRLQEEKRMEEMLRKEGIEL